MIDPNSNEPDSLPPAEEELQRKTRKEWLFVYGFVAVLVLIVALTAYHLMHSH